MSKRPKDLYLIDLIEASQDARRAVGDRSAEEWMADNLARYAVLAHLTVVGEAANRLGSELHKRYDGLPLREIIAFRNVAVHEYRATARADELSDDELRAATPRLADTVRTYAPKSVAVLGITAYRLAFGRPEAAVGPQPERLEGAELWALPNPSGLNAHYQQPVLTEIYAQLREATS